MMRLTTFNLHAFTFLVSFGLVTTACSAEDSVDSAEDDSTGAQTAAGYDFELAGPYERIDAMGVALTSTALTNRDRRQLLSNDGPGDDNQNNYRLSIVFLLVV